MIFYYVEEGEGEDWRLERGLGMWMQRNVGRVSVVPRPVLKHDMPAPHEVAKIYAFLLSVESIKIKQDKKIIGTLCT
jgi:hypothetical protein